MSVPIRIALLSFLELAYPLACAVLMVLVGLAGTGLLLARRSTGRGRLVLARLVVVGVTSLVGLVLAEVSAGCYLAWSHRVPTLGFRAAGPRQAGPNDDVTIVVVGESSAEGVPYRDWLSVGKIVVWQLRRIFPQRMFHLEVQARAGWTLEQMHQKLAEPRRAPDAVIVYAGHNEFASRFGWSEAVPYYDDDRSGAYVERLAQSIARYSRLSQLIHEALGRARVADRPRSGGRELVDAPSHTPLEYAGRLDDFRRRLEAIVGDCRRSGVLPILVVPPGNDAGFEPNRSVLPARTPRAEREAFARDVFAARALESSDPARAEIRYRALIERQPGFAETHFRLARLLEKRGDYEQAYEEYVLARDLDGHPMRCPTSFQDVYRQAARRYDALLIDGQAVLRARHPHGLPGDDLFNDGLHPSFEGHVALAQSILAGLKARRAFGWPDSVSAPVIDLRECADHFDVFAAAWRSVCQFASGFYRTTLLIRHDPTEREAKARRYEEGLRRLEAGISADDLDLPGVGRRPVSLQIKR